MKPYQILIAEDQELSCATFLCSARKVEEELQQQGIESRVVMVPSAQAALDEIARRDYDIIITDVSMPAKGHVRELEVELTYEELAARINQIGRNGDLAVQILDKYRPKQGVYTQVDHDLPMEVSLKIANDQSRVDRSINKILAEIITDRCPGVKIPLRNYTSWDPDTRKEIKMLDLKWDNAYGEKAVKITVSMPEKVDDPKMFKMFKRESRARPSREVVLRDKKIFCLIHGGRYSPEEADKYISWNIDSFDQGSISCYKTGGYFVIKELERKGLRYGILSGHHYDLSLGNLAMLEDSHQRLDELEELIPLIQSQESKREKYDQIFGVVERPSHLTMAHMKKNYAVAVLQMIERGYVNGERKD